MLIVDDSCNLIHTMQKLVLEMLRLFNVKNRLKGKKVLKETGQPVSSLWLNISGGKF